MDMALLLDFMLVATHGGFGRASRADGRSKATLSRHVADLEVDLGVRLVERGERGLKLTEGGIELFESTAGPIAEIRAALERVADKEGSLRGPLRISAAVVFAHAHLAGIAALFSAVHPEVLVEIVADDELADPVESGFDIVIRANPSENDRLVGKRIFRTDRVAVAAPTVLPPPDGEAAQHVYRTGAAPERTWQLKTSGGVRALTLQPALGLSTLLMMHEATIQGAGVALLPRTPVADDLAAGRLVLWGVQEGGGTEVWALYSDRRLVNAKVIAFLRHMQDVFQDVDM